MSRSRSTPAEAGILVAISIVLVAVCFGLAWLALRDGPSSAFPSENDDHRYASRNECDAKLAPFGYLKPADSERNPHEDRQKRRDDLCLQILSTQAAQQAAYWTRWATILAGAAAAAAGFAAKYTLRQADIARQSLIASNRPWIEIKNVDTNGHSLNFGTAITNLNVAIYIENVGTAPATNIMFDVRLAVAQGGKHPTKELIKPPLYVRKQTEEVGLSLFPKKKWPDKGDTIILQGATMETSKIDGLVAKDGGPVDIYLVARCEYTVPADAFNRHVSGVLMEIRQAAGGPLVFRPGTRVHGVTLHAVDGFGQHAT